MEVAQVARTVRAGPAAQRGPDRGDRALARHRPRARSATRARPRSRDADAATTGASSTTRTGCAWSTCSSAATPAFRGLNLSYEVREAFALHAPGDKARARASSAAARCSRRSSWTSATTSPTRPTTSTTASPSGCVTPEEMREADLWRDTWDGVVAEARRPAAAAPGLDGGQARPRRVRVRPARGHLGADRRGGRRLGPRPCARTRTCSSATPTAFGRAAARARAAAPRALLPASAAACARREAGARVPDRDLRGLHERARDARPSLEGVGRRGRRPARGLRLRRRHDRPRGQHRDPSIYACRSSGRRTCRAPSGRATAAVGSGFAAGEGLETRPWPALVVVAKPPPPREARRRTAVQVRPPRLRSRDPRRDAVVG